MIGGRKVRSNKGKRRGSYKTGKTRSGAKFRGRKSYGKRSVKRTRKVRSNKGKRRDPYGPRSRTRSGKKFRGGSAHVSKSSAIDFTPLDASGNACNTNFAS